MPTNDLSTQDLRGICWLSLVRKEAALITSSRMRRVICCYRTLGIHETSGTVALSSALSFFGILITMPQPPTVHTLFTSNDIMVFIMTAFQREVQAKYTSSLIYNRKY